MKSRVARKLALKDIRDYCDSKNIKLKVFINSLEETKEKVIATLISKEIKMYYGVDTNYYKTINYSENLPTEQYEKMIEKGEELVDQKYKNILVITREFIPYNFYKRVLAYLNEVGKFYNIEYYPNGKEKSRKQVDPSSTWNYYEYNEPTIIVTIYDTIDKSSPYKENGIPLNKYESVGRYVGHYASILLGNICKCINFIVSQQLPENETIEVNKMGKTILEKIKPSLSSFRTNKSIAESATLILALFNPLKWGAFNYYGYKNLNLLKRGSYMSMIVLKTREGEIEYPKNEIPLYTQLGIDEFEQLPNPDDTKNLAKYFI